MPAHQLTTEDLRLATPFPLPGRLSLSPGRAADYRALARFHYRLKPPATFAGVWTIRYAPFASPHDDQLIAVAVLSYPTLNLHIRDELLGLSNLSAPERIRFINQHIRTLSRVAVHPTFRSLGLACALVRHILAHAPTRYTEALALMARASPLFARAGMQEHAPADPRKPVYYLHDSLATPDRHS